MSKTKSICGAVRLLCSVFGTEQLEYHAALEKYGVPQRKCLFCNSYLEPHQKENFCNTECKRQYNKIKIFCHSCGKLIIFNQSFLIWRITNNKQRNFFCSRQCSGKFTATNYGFKKGCKRPPCAGRKPIYENISSFIYHLYLKGYKPRHIAKICNLNNIQIYYIIQKNKNSHLAY